MSKAKELKQADLKINFTSVEWVNGNWEITDHNGKKIKTYIHTIKHKYGKDQSYAIFSYYDTIVHRGLRMTVARFIYCWFYGDIPEGYDIDHINNDSLDNRLENLQMLTHADNIRKRGIGRNQNSYDLTDEEILELRRIKEEKKEAARRLKKYKNEYLEYKKQIQYQFLNIKDAQLKIKENIANSDNCHIRARLNVDYKKLSQERMKKGKERKISFEDWLKINYNLTKESL